MKRKLTTVLALGMLIVGISTTVTPGASAAGSSICSSSSCDNPQINTVFGQTQNRIANSSSPSTVCEVLNNWKVDAVIQVVAGVLKVNWVMTLVPTLVCHLIG